MISDDDLYLNMPESPELAFVYLEQEYRSRLFDGKNQTDEHGNILDEYFIEYINRTLAAASTLELNILSGFSIPDHKHVSGVYREFSAAIEHYLVQIRIRNGRRRRAYSVAFDAATKQKIRHYIDQIKDLIEKSELSVDKREQLYSKINDFVHALDTERTPFEAGMALVATLADAVEEHGRKFAPVGKFLQSIVALFGHAKSHEEQAERLLGAPQPRKRLAAPPATPTLPPAQESPAPSGPTPDEEIPF